MNSELLKVKNIVKDAGKIALQHFNKVTGYTKSDGTLVSNVDFTIESFLITNLKNVFGEINIIGEESGCGSFKVALPITIAIDPLDGTAAFLSGLPVWAISIGIFFHREITSGVIYLPLLDELYWYDGKYSYWGDKVLPVLSSSEELGSEDFLAVPSDAHRSLDLRGFAGKTRSMGSIAAHLVYVAKGVAKGAIVKGYPWDLAGGFAILKGVKGCCEYVFSDRGVELFSLFPSSPVPEPIIATSFNLIKIFKAIIKK